QEPLVVRTDALDVQLRGEARTVTIGTDSDRVHFHVAQPADTFHMDAAHEAGSEHDCFESLHHAHQAAPACSVITISLRKAAALDNPSSADIRLSSCSIDST